MLYSQGNRKKMYRIGQNEKKMYRIQVFDLQLYNYKTN
jgi:hypothetical protein